MRLAVKAAAVFVIAFGIGVISATFLSAKTLIILSACLVIMTGLLILRS